MKHARNIIGIATDLRDLEASVDRAGMALACAFSSSAEFEADVIRQRREAGLIGCRHVVQMRGVLALTGTAALAAFLLMVA